MDKIKKLETGFYSIYTEHTNVVFPHCQNSTSLYKLLQKCKKVVISLLTSLLVTI